MDHLFNYLSNFKSQEKIFDNELDTLYYNSLLKGQKKGLEIFKTMFPDPAYVMHPKDMPIVKNELDSYMAQRRSLAAENKEYKDKVENDGYFSGIINILNEGYIYLIRYSSTQAKQEVANIEAGKPADKKDK